MSTYQSRLRREQAQRRDAYRAGNIPKPDPVDALTLRFAWNNPMALFGFVTSGGRMAYLCREHIAERITPGMYAIASAREAFAFDKLEQATRGQGPMMARVTFGGLSFDASNPPGMYIVRDVRDRATTHKHATCKVCRRAERNRSRVITPEPYKAVEDWHGKPIHKR